MSANEFFQTPADFSAITEVGAVVIAYSELGEFGQGSPAVGQLSINGHKLQGLYGGPPLCDGKYVWVPQYERNFWGVKFRIAEIDVASGNLQLLGNKQNMIFLYKFSNERLYFFKDMFKGILCSCLRGNQVEQ